MKSGNKKKPNINSEIPVQSKRLNKFISNAGVCSRREADKLIEAGEITVNGEVIKEMGFQVSREDEVIYDGKKLIGEKLVYVLLNKPKGFVTTTKDPHAEKTVMDLIKKASNERLYPVGRLDKETTGLLMFTNDGELTQKLTHPSNNVTKIYKVDLDKGLTKNHNQQLIDGIELEDGVSSFDELSVLTASKKEVGVELHSGKNRIIRRMFEHVGYRVRKLDRVTFAELTKKDLPRGKWRLLSDNEVFLLKKIKKHPGSPQ